MKGILLSKPLFYGGILTGFGVILFVGLLSGLVGRPNNCIPTSSTSTASPLPTSRVPTTTNASPQTTTTTSKTTTTTKSTTTKPTTTTTTTSTSTTRLPPTATRTLPTAPTQPTTPQLGPSTTKPQNQSEQNAFRLPGNVIPTHYKLEFRVQLQAYVDDASEFDPSFESFKGKTEIHLDIVGEASSILLHASSNLLQLTSYSLKKNDGQSIKITKQSFRPNQILQFELDQKLNSGEKYILTISYDGKYSKSLYGLYTSRYRENGKIK
jgi:hypothetical protein